MLILEVVTSYNSLSGKIYALLRWLICPFSLMERYIPKKGIVYDLGCGEGVLSQYLARASRKRQVIGVDTDERKITLAKAAAKTLTNIRFNKENVFKKKLKKATTAVILSDFLHHLSYTSQERLISQIAIRIKPGGVLLIKEINTSDVIRSRLSRFWDYVFYPEDKIYYRDLSKLKKKLEKFGFSVSIRKEVLYFPGSTNLLFCRKLEMN